MQLNKSFLCLFLLLAFSLSACGKSNTTPPATTGTPAATGTPTATTSGATTKVDAQAVFKQTCVSCHGVNLEGSVGPNLQKEGSKHTKDELATIISNGRGAMPSFKGKLTDDEISSLAVWLADKK
ncbi:c-type cytochrome [Paenibacillus sp. Soil787]|uniref:c-type cytochrome n=1 Tax=Paenibacillus sp. Soil787 TaxID=1736411 RepID=UPI0006F2B8BF|nr:cytochrome c [Paenibacillus sp. Soil787]KRF35823.1 cytochrome c-551 [Paenibacillus sp. Soil787]